ncbi:MAG: MarC family protein [Acidimicrobiales bacterium]
MNLSTAEIYIQAIIAVFMIVNPVDPVKIVIFNDVVSRQELDRRAAALKVAFVTFCILAVVAVIGRELLQLLGINLGAFGVVGGAVVALMGFEMLYGGTSSRTQGTGEVAEEPAEQEGLIMPLAIPLMAGPGAITTVITVSSFKDDGSTIVAALVAVAVVSSLVFFAFAFLGDAISRLSASTTAMLARMGGLLLATIGTQLALGGIRTFYEF